MDRAPQSNVEKQGGIAVAAVSAASIVACLGFLGFVAFALFRAKKGQQSTLIELRLVKNQFGLLFLSLILADLISAFGFFLSVAWVRNGGPLVTSPLCTFQAVMVTGGDLASGMFQLAIAVHTGILVGFQVKPKDWAVWLATIVLWLFVILVESVSPAVVPGRGGQPFYQFTGIWCFTANYYETARFVKYPFAYMDRAHIDGKTTHYLYIFICAIGSLLVYGVVSLRLYQRVAYGRKLGIQTDKAQSVAAKRMMLYPLTYGFVVMPLAGYRLASMAGHTGSRALLAAAGAIFASSGLINVILYGYTRSIFHINLARTSAKSGFQGTQSQIAGNVAISVQQMVVASAQEPWEPDEKKVGMARSPSLELEDLPARSAITVRFDTSNEPQPYSDSWR